MYVAKENNNQNIKILKIISISNICILNNVFVTKTKHSLWFFFSGGGGRQSLTILFGQL